MIKVYLLQVSQDACKIQRQFSGCLVAQIQLYIYLLIEHTVLSAPLTENDRTFLTSINSNRFREAGTLSINIDVFLRSYINLSDLRLHLCMLIAFQARNLEPNYMHCSICHILLLASATIYFLSAEMNF